MAVYLRYPVNPDFTVNNVNYNPCGNLRRPLPYTGDNGLPPELPFQNYAPYVVAKFVIATNKRNSDLDGIAPDGERTILITTGSNLGTPKDKQAFIKSVSMGVSQSYGATLEIIDTSGQDFTRFYNSVYQSVCETRNEPQQGRNTEVLKVGLLFGYVFTNENGDRAVYEQSFTERKSVGKRKPTKFIYFFVEKIDVTFDNNIWKYKIILKAPDMAVAQRKVRKSRGDLRNRMPLLTACELMLDGECTPKPAGKNDDDRRVVLVKPPSNAQGEWAYTKQLNADDTNNGQTGVYPGYNLPPLDAIQKNLNMFITTDQKGVFMCYPTGSPDDSLYLIEAESPECSSKRVNIANDQCGQGVFWGTYVVNGGDFSPVISFNPKIEFVGVPNKLEGAANARNNSTKSIPLRSCGDRFNNNQNNANQNNETPGLTAKSNEAATDNARTIAPPSEISNKIATSRSAALSAELRAKPMLGSITAELTIQGDPRFLWSLNVVGSSIKIIFINPFTVVQSDVFEDGKINGTWLSSPTISDQISRATYLINGCDHEVSDGKWITKLKLIGVEDRKRRA